MTSFREQLIASALQGLLANSGGPLQHCASSGFAFTNCTVADVAKLAVELADAVLACANESYAPLPLLVRDVANEFQISVLKVCNMLRDMGNFSANSAVTPAMMARIRAALKADTYA